MNGHTEMATGKGMAKLRTTKQNYNINFKAKWKSQDSARPPPSQCYKVLQDPVFTTTTHLPQVGPSPEEGVPLDSRLTTPSRL